LICMAIVGPAAVEVAGILLAISLVLVGVTWIVHRLLIGTTPSTDGPSDNESQKKGIS
jgi:hypothetical protein